MNDNNLSEWFGNYKQTGINQHYGQIKPTSYDYVIEYWTRQLGALKVLYDLLNSILKGVYMSCNNCSNKCEDCFEVGVFVDDFNDDDSQLDCPFCYNVLRLTDDGTCSDCGEIIQ